MSKAAELIAYEDTILHDKWKEGDGGLTLFGQVVTNSEKKAKAEYVQLANAWLTQAAAAIEARAGNAMEISTLQRLYTKILGRRDDLVRQGFGRISPAGEDLVAKVANKITPPSEWDKYAKYVLIALALLLAIVLLK
jgi:hypothetical protein